MPLVPLRGAALAAVMAGLFPCARAGDFAVIPVRLEIGGPLRSGAFTVRNEDRTTLNFQVRGMDWSQDDQGRDQYRDSSDLVYFPRQLTLEPGQEAVIRVGLRQATVPVERAFRLFIDEVPPPETPAESVAAGARLRVSFSFGAPVFVRPAQPTQQLALEPATWVDGRLAASLRNSGNVHAQFEAATLRGLDGTGQSLFTQALPVRYLLAGQRVPLDLPLQAGACHQLMRLTVDATLVGSAKPQALDAGVAPCP